MPKKLLDGHNRIYYQIVVTNKDNGLLRKYFLEKSR
ncbi:hypothetical protein Cycma_0395 [Cyclobacterium marinum DSM 745]|uniref:Uncharacterized protein n=1 Tax=Cyclobacterium marinum (strain ATCC 25205 / DSM 745 / LMG 13164 / NCIMB 1802) TaxID=880070 RepID=G0IVH8_CYCMS|nr:hypothetical protein Cycma_0395 [Cyclobacterium marinum DSM 745]